MPNVEDYIPARQAYGPSAHTWNLKPQSLLKMKKGLARVRLGLGDMKILCGCDSNTLGYGTSDANRTNKNGYPAQLSRLLATQGLPAVEGMSAPQVNALILDNRLASTGTWDGAAASAGLGWGSNGGIKGYWFCNTDLSTRTFSPGTGVFWDRADIYYTSHTTTGNATIQATGGAAFNLTAGGVTLVNAVVQKTTISAGSLADTNTVTITKSGTAPIFLLGIEVWNSTKSQIRIANAGIASSSAFGWNGFNASFPNLRSGKCIEAYQPDLMVMGVGTNDAHISARTLNQYLTDVSALIANVQVTGDVILMSSFPYGVANPTVAALIASYAQGLRGLGIPFLDIHNRMGAYAAYNTAGYMFGDGLHGNDNSHNEIAGWLANILTTV